MKILVSGASGLVGSALCRHLEESGHSVLKLVRRKPRISTEYQWSPSQGLIPVESLEEADAVINLAGEGIANGRWSRIRKEKIYDSRILSTRLIVQGIEKSSNPPNVFISASAVGYYGSRGEEILREDSSPGDLFLSRVCKDWESEAFAAAKLGVRVVCPRISMVLALDGGALKKMLPPFRLGLGGRVGDGKQIVSWITISDLVRALAFCVENSNVNGPVNLCSPEPVTNNQFSKTLAKVLSRPARLPVPAFVLRLIFGEMADELLLSSARCSPERICKIGFRFQDYTLEAALRVLLTS